jgi:hypothetical protein
MPGRETSGRQNKSGKQGIASFHAGKAQRKEKEMKAVKWTTLVVVLVLLSSVGCATVAGTNGMSRGDYGTEFQMSNKLRTITP